MSLSENESEIARCTLCGEPMPAGEEMFKFHGYSGPCPTPAPKPPQKATCETNGHIYGHEGVCLFCRTPKPTPEPQTVCAWRLNPANKRFDTSCQRRYAVLPREVEEFKVCPHCTLPLKLSPESPKEGAK